MTSIKLKFRPSTISYKEGSIYYQIIHDRKIRQLPTDYHIFPSEWNSRHAKIRPVENADSDRYPHILSLNENIRCDIERLNRIIKSFESYDLVFSADDIIDKFHQYSHRYTIYNFMKYQIVKLKQNGKIRTSETYNATLNSFSRFLHSSIQPHRLIGSNDISLDFITADLIESYQAYLLDHGVSFNTISFYMRILRAVYNRAVEENIIEQRHPFRHVYTGVEKTIKRAIPLNMIKRIKTLDLSQNQELDYARDMFMMSFYTRGMSFIDMAYLKKSDLTGHTLTYIRRKTQQQLHIQWTSEMQQILDKYPENPTPYLLPIIKNPANKERYAYRNMSYFINRNLKKIAQIIGINIPLTMYVARHSWASIAKAKGIPLSIISEGMGHDSESTTQIYLASLDTNAVDRANALILKSL